MTTFLINRGFTMHEHLKEFNLINMLSEAKSHSEAFAGNGRVYDPITARFLSPDPVIQEPANTQNHNRYSYVLNNPLRYSDPSGYNFFDGVGNVLEGFINAVTMPGRILSAGNEWLNDKINGTPSPYGYFDLNYIVNGVFPGPGNPYYLVNTGCSNNDFFMSPHGFVAADETFYSNDYLSYEAWAYRAASHQAAETGDFNNMDIWTDFDRYKWVETPGTSFLPPTDPPKKDGDQTKEEDKGSSGGLTLSEAKAHYQFGRGIPVHVSLSCIDLSKVSMSDFNERGLATIRLDTKHFSSTNDALVHGTITLQLIPGTNQAKIALNSGRDYPQLTGHPAGMYNFEMQSWGSAINWVRNPATFVGGLINGTFIVPGPSGLIPIYTGGTPFPIYYHGIVSIPQ